MQSLISFLPTKADYSRLSVWIFFIAWLIGVGALNGGLNGLGEHGLAKVFSRLPALFGGEPIAWAGLRTEMGIQQGSW